MKNFNSILNKVVEKVKPSKEELLIIESFLKDFLIEFKSKLSSLKIKAEVFVGGSYAKKTMIKKDNYDIDIFVRFDKSYKDEKLSGMVEKALKPTKNVSVVHGSRDYFRIKVTENLFFEIIPVKKVTNPEQSDNITDLSCSHVEYINKKVKSKKLLDEIMLAKAFCYATHCYGAESYINGFSGYSLELLVYYYGSFLKFIKAVLKIKKEKEVIDPEKHFKKKNIALLDINASKLVSPIILIDPTYKQRNALAALSYETLNRFKKEIIEFLKKPSEESFEPSKTDLEEIKKEAEKSKCEFILLEATTNKQEGDVAGGKLWKFHKHLNYELKKYFTVKKKGFNYNDQQASRYFFVAKSKKEILISGPNMNDTVNVKAFKKAHADYFTKKGRIFSKEIIDYNLKDFFARWISKNRGKIKEMYITNLDFIDPE